MITLSRRRLFGVAGATALIDATATATEPATHAVDRTAESDSQDGAADHSIRIGTGLIELGPDAAVSTTLYSGQFPGPLLRLTEGRRVVVDIHNDTDSPEQLHWHGQSLPGDVDGATEEGTPFIPPHAMRRVAFTPGPSGFRFYHTHRSAGSDLAAGLYSGQIGLVYVEPRHDNGAYDHETFITLKEFGPFLSHTEMPHDFLSPKTQDPALRAAAQAALNAAVAQGRAEPYEVAYNFFAINGRMLGNGEPIRVRPGERLLLHVLNASATEIRSLALPGHTFKVLALDGNPVPRPAEVPVLWLGPAERISAVVEMRHPGVWVLGDLMDEDRNRGMGVVVEYAGRNGKPGWTKPAPFRWDYRRFGHPGPVATEPDETIVINFGSRGRNGEGFEQFAINGVSFSMDRMEPMFRLRRNGRYRLHLRNATDDAHPLHLHRHSFELTSIAGMPTAGVVKDVVMLGGFQEMTVDFTADQPGRTLFHCHMQHHMDFGFMALFDCA